MITPTSLSQPQTRVLPEWSRKQPWRTPQQSAAMAARLAPGLLLPRNLEQGGLPFEDLEEWEGEEPQDGGIYTLESGPDTAEVYSMSRKYVVRHLFPLQLISSVMAGAAAVALFDFVVWAVTGEAALEPFFDLMVLISAGGTAVSSIMGLYSLRR